MTIVASNSLTISNVNDGTITHTAYSYSADGTDGFTTTYPNLNLLEGTKDFSGVWHWADTWTNDRPYKGLTVKKRTGQWNGIYKTFTAPKDGIYTFSAYVKGSGIDSKIYRFLSVNGVVNGTVMPDTLIGNNFDWLRDSFTVTLKANDVVYAKYEIVGSGTDSILWTAGHKWEEGSTATPYMPSASEVTTADWPSYIGQYSDFTQADSTNPSDYTWSLIRGNDGKDGADGHDGIAGKDGTGIKTTTITYAVGTSGTTAPTGGWNSQVPNVPAGQYLWTKTVWDYTDKTSETGYSVSKFGEKGDKGDQGVQGIQGVDGRQGIPGPKGADGKTQYTHIAYANSADGVTDFSTSDSNRAYIGMYVDFNINDSTTPSDYSWTLVKGADGTQGTPGKPGADGKTPYFHTAWSYSADGKDRFTTVYPNLNLLDGTRNFSGTWTNSSSWVTDGTYKGLTVKKRTGQWNGIYKTFTAPKDGIYTFSAYVKGSGIDSKIYRFLSVNGVVNGTVMPDTLIGNNFDWLRDSFTVTLKANDVVYAKYEIVGSGTDSILWTAGHKWEEGSTATPYMPSASEVTTADWPSYIGQYSDFTQADSTNPSDYTWSLIRGNDGKDGDMGKSVWSYPYDRGANRLGSWWSDLKPTPTTDNPPKVGDTIIDLVGKIYQITNVVVDSTIGGGGLFDYGPMLTSIKGADGSPGKDGIAGKDGVGLKSTIITYGISASDSTMPGTWSQNTPALVKGQWFWTKTQWTYTDNSTETGYQKTYISKDGNNGHDGIAGKDGTGIKTTTITYAGSTSGTTAPTIGWNSQVPSVPAGQFLWTKTVWTYTDNTSETGYSVAMMGVKGQDSNAYTAYSWSADGTDRFTTVYPNLNLLVNSSAKTKDGFFKNFDKVENGYGEVTRKGNNSYAGISMWDGFSIQPGDYKPGDTYTMSMDVMFTSWNFPAGVYLEEFWIGQRYTHNSDWSINSWKRICYIDLPKDPSKMLNQWIRITQTSTIPPHEDPSVSTDTIFMTKFSGSGEASFTIRVRKPKQEPGSVATPWMSSQSESQEQWQDAIPMYVGVGDKDSQNPSDYRWQLNSKYVQASSDSGLSDKAGLDDLASVANTANNALVQAQNAVSNEDYTSWLEHNYQSTIDNLQDVSTQNQEDINNIDDRTTIMEGFYGEMKVKWNFIDESFTFSEEGMFISNAQSKMAIQVTSDKIVFWDNNVDVAFITGEVLNIQKGVFLESATIGNHLITKFSNESPVTIIRYVGGIT